MRPFLALLCLALLPAPGCVAPAPSEDPPVDQSTEIAVLRLLGQGAEALAADRAQDAIGPLEEAFELGAASDPVARFLRGVARLDLGRLDAAREDLQAAVALAPDDVASWAALARTEQQAGDGEAAVAAARQAALVEKDNAQLLVFLGNLQLDFGFWDDAFDSLQQAVALDPEQVDAHRALAVLFSRVGEAERAERSWRSALRLSPEDALLHAGLGHTLRDLGRDEEALSSYRSARQLESDCAVHAANIAATLVSLGRLRAARVEFERALMLPRIPDEQCAYLHLQLGGLLESLGERGGAEDEYRFALEHDEHLAQAHLRLGLLELDRGRPASALDHLGSALAGGAATAEAVLQLALVAGEQGQPNLVSECADLLAQASEIDPQGAVRYARFMLRSSDPRWHDPESAIVILHDLLSGPLAENGATWSLLGEALAQAGDYRGALVATEHALAHEDETSPARRRIEAMRNWYLTLLAER